MTASTAEASGSKPPFWATAIGTFFGAGLSPKAPGTVGSLASLVLWAPLVVLDVSWWIRALVTGVVFVVGTVAANAIVRARGQEDPQLVVVDEVAGMGVTLLFAPGGSLAVTSLVAGFLLFRLFDIWKPWPVRLADRRIKGGFGVMFDDILAGLYALGFLSLFIHFVIPRVLPMVAGSTEVSL